MENKDPDCFVGMQSYIFLCIFSLIFLKSCILRVKRIFTEPLREGHISA